MRQPFWDKAENVALGRICPNCELPTTDRNGCGCSRRKQFVRESAEIADFVENTRDVSRADQKMIQNAAVSAASRLARTCAISADQREEDRAEMSRFLNINPRWRPARSRRNPTRKTTEPM